MSLTIPIWLLWTLGIIGGVLFVAVIVFILLLAWFGWLIGSSIGKGLNW